MITFYYTPDCEGCGSIEAALQKNSVEHQVVVVLNAEEKKKHFSTNVALPILKNEHLVFSGMEEICEHLGAVLEIESPVCAPCSCVMHEKTV